MTMSTYVADFCTNIANQKTDNGMYIVQKNFKFTLFFEQTLYVDIKEGYMEDKVHASWMK